MPKYTTKKETGFSKPVGKAGKYGLVDSWIVLEDGKRCGEFSVEQKAIEYRDKLAALYDSEDKS